MTIDALETLDDGEVPDSLTIGRRIRQLRTDRGMTLEDLAVALGLVGVGKRERRQRS